MPIPVHRQLQLDIALGILFGNNTLRAHANAAADAHTWTIADYPGDVPIVDTGAYLRWGSSELKSGLRVPSGYLGVGAGSAQHLLVGNGSLSLDALLTLPSRSGTLALLDDAQQGALQGFEIYTTATTIVVGPGFAEVNGRMVSFAGATISDSRAANTTYQLYLTSAGTIERVTTAFAAPYYGNARKRGSGVGAADTRWLAQVRTNDGTTTTNYPLLRYGPGESVEAFHKQNSGLAPFNLVQNQNYAVLTTVFFNQNAPPGPTRQVYIRLQFGGTGSQSRVAGYSGAPGTTGGVFTVSTNTPNTGVNSIWVEVDGSPSFQVDGGSVSAFVHGWRFVR